MSAVVACLFYLVGMVGVIAAAEVARCRRRILVLEGNARVSAAYVRQLEETQEQLHTAVAEARGERAEEIDRLANERAIALRDSAIAGVGALARRGVAARVEEVGRELRKQKLAGYDRAAYRLEQLATELRGATDTKGAANA